MKTLALLTTVVLTSLLAPQAHAAKLGKLAGTYTGGGVVVDKRNAPLNTYRFTFTNLAVTVSPKKKISGSSTVLAEVSFAGGPYSPITTQQVSVTGTVTSVTVKGKKLVASGELTFSDGTKVNGTFSVAAKTGKGKFLVKQSDASFDIDFTASKKK